MPITRLFLGFERPALAAAATYLLARYTRENAVELSQAIVVVPAARAGRRLLEILVAECAQRSLVLKPPLIETVGAVPEQLYEIKRPLASDLTQQLAWVQALKDTPAAALRQVIARPPDAARWDQWLRLGELLQTQHRELASEQLDFAAVLRQAVALPGFDEEPRWRVLADVQARYLQLLDGLGQWDRQTARLFAVVHRECRTEHDFVLVGVADMNRTLRAMLDQVADRVTALIAGPDDWSDRFDSHGCVIPSAWQESPLAIADEQIARVDGPADQAQEVARQIAAYDGHFRADEILVGLCDESLAPQIARQLSECQQTTRFVNARTLRQTAPLRLLEVLAEYVESGSFTAFASLVRHPDVYAWLLGQGVEEGFLTQLDDMQPARLPLEFSEHAPWLEASDRWRGAAQALVLVRAWLADLAGPQRTPRAWSEPVQTALLALYRDRRPPLRRSQPSDRDTLAALEAIRTALDAWSEIPAHLASASTATATLTWLLDRIADDPLPPPADDTAIEMLGWLELPLDDAPALIVTTFNEGFVPSARGADMFLPDRLRAHLGVSDSERLFARDAYATHVLVGSQARLSFIIARRNLDDEPLHPSRLLFLSQPEEAAKRALRFFEKPPPAGPKLLLGGAFAGQAESALVVPRPILQPQSLTKISVTDFKSYLACPYRFYLRRVLKLRSVADGAEELDALQFGNFMHDVLQAFGEKEQRGERETDERRLAEWLSDELMRLAEEKLGSRRRPVVNVQLEQVRLRLQAFAAWQSKRSQEGWQICKVEESLSQKLQFGPYEIVVEGRVDRIDFHEGENRHMILDYKTGDRGLTPQQTHRVGQEWVDLQLPLYRTLALGVEGITAAPEVGYVLLPKDTSQVGASLPDWSAAEWNSAHDVAAAVVEGIMTQTFWPPRYDGLSDEELAFICQEGVAGRKLAGEDAEEAI